VWVERVQIEGFRGLHGSFEFARGLNVVVGPNESGKSSLHEALIRLLCGFSRTERRRNRGSSLRERLAPWDGRQYALTGRVRDDERIYDIRWDFAAHAVQLTDERGRDRSDEVLSRGDDVKLGDFLFGVGPDDFRQVCCVDQDALLGVRHSPSLGVALQEAVANVVGDVAVEDAIERLNEFLRSVVGVRIDTLSPTAAGRLSALARERCELIQTLTVSEEVRERLSQTSAEAGRLRRWHEERLRERETLRQRQLLSEAEALTERLEEARRLAAAAAAQPEAPGLEEAAIDEVKIARERLGQLDQDLEAAERDAAAAQPEVEQLEAELRNLVPLVDGLKLYADLDTSQQADVQRASAALAELPVLPDEPREMPQRDPLLARYRNEREALRDLLRRPRHPRLRRAGWIALVVLTVGIALAVRELVRRWRGPRADALTERLAVFGASSLDELDDRCVEEDAQFARAEAKAEARAEQQRTTAARRAELTGTIERALDAAGVPKAPLDERIAAYLEGCQRHAQLIEKQAELERIRRQLAEARRPSDEVARCRRERETVERTLHAAYTASGIDAPSLEEAGRLFDELVAASVRARKAAQEAEAARTALRLLLGGETMEALAARRDEVHRVHREHVAAHGELAAACGDPAQLSQELATMDDELRGEAKRLAELETEARRLEEDAGDPATVKERLAAIDAESERLAEARDALALARELLRESADELSREFAPHLNEALRRNLTRITGGRYGEARVDNDLSVKVVVPETGYVVSADDLSRATKDQIFLVQRLEIARLLAPTKGSPPLLLDDPFAHYDNERLRYGLEILAEVAEERQVILFSEDPVLAGLVLEIRGECRVVELETPRVSTGVTAS